MAKSKRNQSNHITIIANLMLLALLAFAPVAYSVAHDKSTAIQRNFQ